jgi:GDSL-like Lipase/Acylhydrolase family
MEMILLTILGITFGLFVLLEAGLRLRFGLGNPLVYLPDEEIGYLIAPNQKTRRNGKLIEINQYSMRSAPVDKIPLDSTLRILLVGDSIANGGWWTDQENTVSSLMMKSLSSVNTIKYKNIEVLNASANSWGPMNELAYLQKFGSFNSQITVQMINTDDLFATKPTSLQIGRDRNYPQTKPPLAIVEVFQRYIIKSQPIPELLALQNAEGDRIEPNLVSMGKVKALAAANNCLYLLIMTPLKRELGEPGSRDYEVIARQRLFDFTQAQGMIYIDFLPLFNSHPDPKSLYHDHIHINFQGNQFVSGVVEQRLLELLSQKLSELIKS